MGRNENSTEISIELNESIDSIVMNDIINKQEKTPNFSIDFNNTSQVIQQFDKFHGI